MSHHPARCVAIALSICWTEASALCGGALSNNSLGRPLDYFAAQDAEDVRLVEQYSFPPEVERLERGASGELPGDIHVVLMSVPNHHRALHAMATWEIRHKAAGKGPPGGVTFLGAECYFQRAFAFKPEDPTIHLIYGVYLHKSREFDKAMQAYTTARDLKPSSPEVHYNLGLLHFDLEQYDEAVASAREAYRLGYPLRGLRNKLRRIGRSVE